MEHIRSGQIGKRELLPKKREAKERMGGRRRRKPKPFRRGYPRIEDDPDDPTKQVLVKLVWGERVEIPVIPLTREQVLANINPLKVTISR